MNQLDRDDFQAYLQLMLDKPNEIHAIVSELISKAGSLEPGTALDATMNKWFGHKSLLGATSPASLISWLDANTSSTMKWVIRDSVSSCMAAAGIENLRYLKTYQAGILIANLQRRASFQISEKKQFIEFVKELNRADCIDLIDAIELIDAVICDRIDLILATAKIKFIHANCITV